MSISLARRLICCSASRFIASFIWEYFLNTSEFPCRSNCTTHSFLGLRPVWFEGNVAVRRLPPLSPLADIGNRGDQCVFVHRSIWGLLCASAEKPCVLTRRPWPRKSA